jgi:muramidase (phage lysozyme)
MLKYKDQGRDVAKLQRYLNFWGIPTTIDGIFGPQTQESVKTFQLKRQGECKYAGAPLIPNGIVDNATWAELTKTPLKEVMESSKEIHPQIAAFLKMIRVPEGTEGSDGYNKMFTGKLFYDFSDHPRIIQEGGGYRSDAAGAYQFLSTTWDEVAKTIGAPDFTPYWQDMGAIQLIKWEGAYEDVINGHITSALNKCSWQWASLPPGRYNQPSISFRECIALFKSYGGKTNE